MGGMGGMPGMGGMGGGRSGRAGQGGRPNGPMFGPDSPVELLSAKSLPFNKAFKDSLDTHIVFFFDPKEGKSRKLQAPYEAAAKKLQGYVKVGAVDGAKDKKLAQKYKLKKMPALLVFVDGKHKVYKGKLDAASITEFAMESIPQMRVLRSASALTEHLSADTPLTRVVIFTSSKVSPLYRVLAREYTDLLACAAIVKADDEAAYAEMSELLNTAAVPAIIVQSGANRFHYTGAMKHAEVRKAFQSLANTAKQGKPPAFKHFSPLSAAPPAVPGEVLALTATNAQPVLMERAGYSVLLLVADPSKHSATAASLAHKYRADPLHFAVAPSKEAKGLGASFGVPGGQDALVAFKAKKLRYVSLAGPLSEERATAFLDSLLGGTASLKSLPYAPQW